MAKPPKTPPHSDITGVNRDARVGDGNVDPKQGTAEDLEKAERESAGRPAKSGKLSPST